MSTQLPNTEQKEIIKTIIKYIEKVNPNTPYQYRIKNDIQYIANVLNVEDLELWITCTRFISENYSYILTRGGFSLLTEEAIRQRGNLWIYKNLIAMAQTLQQALNVECITTSITERFTENMAEKIVERIMKL